MLHKWFDMYILCCCNSLHRQMVPMASEHADFPPTHTLIHILNISLKAILFQTPPPSRMHTLIHTQYISLQSGWEGLVVGEYYSFPLYTPSQ